MAKSTFKYVELHLPFEVPNAALRCMKLKIQNFSYPSASFSSILILISQSESSPSNPQLLPQP
jgi:hypothetical protein